MFKLSRHTFRFYLIQSSEFEPFVENKLKLQADERKSLIKICRIEKRFKFSPYFLEMENLFYVNVSRRNNL